MKSRKQLRLVLAIYFQTSGYGFVLLEQRSSPVDWGAPEVRGRDRAKRCLRQIDSLLKLHTPDVLVLQDTTRRGTRRAPRIQALNHQTLLLAKRRGIRVRTYSRDQVREYFKDFGATTKQRIAETIAKHIRALSLYVPPPRKPWKSEDARMGIFEAAALVRTHLQSSGGAS
jgi:exonuclease III